MNGYYAGIGSRSTPDSIQAYITNLAENLRNSGWALSSGNAEGADKSFYRGHKLGNGPGCRIYLPWDGFEGLYHSPEEGIYDSNRFKTFDTAKKIAIDLRGGSYGLGRGGISLIARNIFQIAGHSLSEPVDFVVCYAKPKGKKGRVHGGTDIACHMAIKMDIPIYNLYFEDVRKELLEISYG